MEFQRKQMLWYTCKQACAGAAAGTHTRPPVSCLCCCAVCISHEGLRSHTLKLPEDVPFIILTTSHYASENEMGSEALRDLGKNDTASHFAVSLKLRNKMILLLYY